MTHFQIQESMIRCKGTRPLSMIIYFSRFNINFVLSTHKILLYEPQSQGNFSLSLEWGI